MAYSLSGEFLYLTEELAGTCLVDSRLPAEPKVNSL